jgi:MFS transporter, DHA1 family, multidrug resistance protein
VHFGLKVPLLAQALFSLFALLMIVTTFQETLITKNKNALQPSQMLRTWLQIVKHPVFLTFSAISSASYGVLFVFLSTSSFVFIKHFGFSVQSYGLVMLGMSSHYLAGTFLCRHLLARFGMAKTMRIAGLMTCVGALVMLVLALVGVDHHLAVMLPVFLMSVGHGIHQPCGQTGAIAPFGHAAGTAAALNGFFMMFLAFMTSMWLGFLQSLLPTDSTLPMIYTLCFWAFSLSLAAWTAVQKHALK